ncbi:hypothetical protein AOLI_G00152080 [Acnodon oligacanthus]
MEKPTGCPRHDSEGRNYALLKRDQKAIQLCGNPIRNYTEFRKTRSKALSASLFGASAHWSRKCFGPAQMLWQSGAESYNLSGTQVAWDGGDGSPRATPNAPIAHVLPSYTPRSLQQGTSATAVLLIIISQTVVRKAPGASPASTFFTTQ